MLKKNAYIKAAALLVGIMLVSISIGYENLVKVLTIPSSAVIMTSTPFSPLHIGDQVKGENPCFFYDRSGKLVTIRLLGQYDFWPGYGTFWESVNRQIEVNKNVSANCFRIQLYFNRIFPARRVGFEKNATVNGILDELVKALNNIVSNGSYYIITFPFFDDEGSGWYTQHPNFGAWWPKEARDTSIFWNRTVQDDFKWALNQTFWKIHNATINGDSLMNYMVYWSFNEWLWTVGSMMDEGTNNFGDMARNPWRFGGKSYPSVSLTPSVGSRSIANQSWVNWLRDRYVGNINLLKDAWNITDDYGDWNDPSAQYWNYDGSETNDFNSLLMPSGFSGWNTGRWYDFTQWYTECMINLTREWKDFVKQTYGTQILYGADTLPPIQHFYCKADSCGFSPAAHALVSDVLIYHIYATIYDVGTSDPAWFQGDWYETQFMDIGAFGRAVMKPSVIDECGYSAWWTDEGANQWQYWIVGYQNVSMSLAIQNGLAGLGQWYGCIRWYGTNETAYETQEYQRLMRTIFDKYKAAENWIDKIRYDKICVVEHIGGAGLSRYVLEWLKEAGFNPAYKVLAWNETHLLPSIPADTEIVIADPSLEGNTYIANGTVAAYNKSISEGKKLMIFGVRKGGSVYWKGFNAHWENQISKAYLPISSATYETNYRNLLENDTVVHVSLYGRLIPIRRDAGNGWYARNTVEWNDQSITGTRLINLTDGAVQNGHPQPFCIANDKVAWVSNLLGETSELYGSGEYSGGVKLDSGYGLIFRGILEQWMIYPLVTVSSASTSVEKVEINYADLTNSYGVLVIHNRNFTYEKFSFKFDLSTSGLDANASYVFFSEYNNTVSGPFNSSQLRTNGLTLFLPENQTSIFTLRKYGIPSLLYSMLGYVGENYGYGVLSVILSARSASAGTVRIYRGGLNIASLQINGVDTGYSVKGELILIDAQFREGYSDLAVTFA